MRPEVRHALVRSIKHWAKNEQVLQSWEPDIGPDDCALCDLFYDWDCRGCPIRIATGLEYCEGSPYRKTHFAIADWRDANPDDFLSQWRAREKFKNRARDMRQFLEGLLCEATSDK